MVSTMFKEAAAGGGGGDGEHYSRLIRELCALLVTIISLSAASPSQRRQATGPTRTPRSTATTGVSPAAAASMLLGASMALMLCGSVTFAIGLFLMPWVAGIAMLLGFAAAVSALSTEVFGKDAARGRVPSSPAIHASDKPVVA